MPAAWARRSGNQRGDRKHRAEEEEEIKTVARKYGWRTLREEGLRLVEEERSTLEEVLRVTHAETEARTRAEQDPIMNAVLKG